MAPDAARPNTDPHDLPVAPGAWVLVDADVPFRGRYVRSTGDSLVLVERRGEGMESVIAWNDVRRVRVRVPGWEDRPRRLRNAVIAATVLTVAGWGWEAFVLDTLGPVPVAASAQQDTRAIVRGGFALGAGIVGFVLGLGWPRYRQVYPTPP